MSLATNVSDLATRAATEDKSLRTLINGNLPTLGALTTTAKTNLVAALNEVRAATTALINDSTTTTSSTWSSTAISTQISAATAALVAAAPTALDTLDELAAALGDDSNFAATMTTALGNRVRVDATQGLDSTQQAQARINIGAAADADLGDPDVDLVGTFESGLLS